MKLLLGSRAFICAGAMCKGTQRFLCVHQCTAIYERKIHALFNGFLQCRTGLGVCPDALDDRGTCSNDVLNVHGTTTNRKQCVSFTRPFRTGEREGRGGEGRGGEGRGGEGRGGEGRGGEGSGEGRGREGRGERGEGGKEEGREGEGEREGRREKEGERIGREKQTIILYCCQMMMTVTFQLSPMNSST